MPISRGVGSAIAAIVGIVVLVVAVVLVVNVVRSEPPVKELILKNVELRNANVTVERAELVTTIDQIVADVGHEAVTDQWKRMLDCLPAKCPDAAFLDMALIVAVNFDLPESGVLVDVITTAKYWGNPEHMLEFSKALSSANEKIGEFEKRGVEKAWQKVVECNGECAEMNDLYFDLITSIVR